MDRQVVSQDLIYNDGSTQTLTTSTNMEYPLLARIPHDTERVSHDGDDLRYIPNTPKPWPVGHIRRDVRNKGAALPEVFRVYPHHHVRLIKPLQLLWYGVNEENLTPDKWWTLVDWRLAFCNMGAGHSSTNPKNNYVTGKLGTDDPRFDQARFTGGHIARGKIVGSRVYFHSVDVTQPLPTKKELLADERRWYWATSISPSGRIQYFHRMGRDGTLKRVRIPYFTVGPTWLPKDEVHILQPGEPLYENHQIVHK